MSDAVRTVIRCIEQVFENKGLPAPPLRPETVLDRSIGLQSLDFAELVVRLEGEFGVDPFSEGAAVDVLSVGQLAELYSALQRAAG